MSLERPSGARASPLFAHGAIQLALLAACTSPAPGVAPRTSVQNEAESLESQASRLALASRPVAEHRALDALAGSWSIELVSVDAAGHEQSLARGHADIRWVLGRRFLRWDASLIIGGPEQSTTGHLGFDSASRQYQLLMISSLATGMGVARGDGDLHGRGITFVLEQFDPDTGVRRRMSTVLRMLASGHFVLDQIGLDAAGIERVVRRSHYRRRGAAESGAEQELAPLDAPDAQRERDDEQNGQARERAP